MAQPSDIKGIPQPGPQPEHGSGKRPPVSGLIDWADLWANGQAGPSWLVEPLIPAGKRSTIIYSLKGQGKSELLLYVAAMLALGRPVLRSTPDRPVRVLYIDNEMNEDDLLDRLQSFGLTADDDLSNLRYHLLPDLPPLNTAEGGDMMMALVDYHQAELVILDTMTRAVVGRENDPEPIKDLGHHVTRRLKLQGIPSVWAGHAGKNVRKGQRGTSEFGGIDDYVLAMSRASGSEVVMTADKVRARWLPARVTLKRVVAGDLIEWTVPNASLTYAESALVTALDDLGAEPGVSVRAARELLNKNSIPAGNAALAAAIRHRRNAAA